MTGEEAFVERLAVLAEELEQNRRHVERIVVNGATFKHEGMAQEFRARLTTLRFSIKKLAELTP